MNSFSALDKIGTLQSIARGLGKTVVLTRTLTSASVMEAGVTVYDGDKVVLSTSSWFGKLSDEPPLMHESWNGKWELTKRREDWTSSDPHRL